MLKLWSCGLRAPVERYRHRRSAHLALNSARHLTCILVGMLVSQTPKRKKEEVKRSGAPAGAPAAGGISGGSQIVFESTGLDTILAATGVTKGALHYHFASKKALRNALVEEIIGAPTRDKGLRPLRSGANPINPLIGIGQATSGPEVVRAGCSLNNLAQEMSQRDERWRRCSKAGKA